MDLQAAKIELATLILNSQNADLIRKIREVVKTEAHDFWLTLSEEQKEEIAISRKQMMSGEVQDWETLKEKLL